jgi:pentatricopeptide repeat protein
MQNIVNYSCTKHSSPLSNARTINSLCDRLRRAPAGAIHPNTIHTYNMMMKSYFLGWRNYAMGCAVWDEMHWKGISPDVNSYTVFINGHILLENVLSYRYMSLGPPPV